MRTVHVQRRGNATLGICRPLLLRWTSTLYTDPACLVQISPHSFHVWHRLGLARDEVHDLELIFLVSSRPDCNSQDFTGFRVRRGQTKGITLILMADLVERANQAECALSLRPVRPGRQHNPERCPAVPTGPQLDSRAPPRAASPTPSSHETTRHTSQRGPAG